MKSGNCYNRLGTNADEKKLRRNFHRLVTRYLVVVRVESADELSLVLGVARVVVEELAGGRSEGQGQGQEAKIRARHCTCKAKINEWDLTGTWSCLKGNGAHNYTLDSR